MKYRVIQTISRECFIEAENLEAAKEEATELADEDFGPSFLLDEIVETEE